MPAPQQCRRAAVRRVQTGTNTGCAAARTSRHCSHRCAQCRAHVRVHAAWRRKTMSRPTARQGPLRSVPARRELASAMRRPGCLQAPSLSPQRHRPDAEIAVRMILDLDEPNAADPLPCVHGLANPLLGFTNELRIEVVDCRSQQPLARGIQRKCSVMEGVSNFGVRQVPSVRRVRTERRVSPACRVSLRSLSSLARMNSLSSLRETEGAFENEVRGPCRAGRGEIRETMRRGLAHLHSEACWRWPSRQPVNARGQD